MNDVALPPMRNKFKKASVSQFNVPYDRMTVQTVPAQERVLEADQNPAGQLSRKNRKMIYDPLGREP